MPDNTPQKEERRMGRREWLRRIAGAVAGATVLGTLAKDGKTDESPTQGISISGSTPASDARRKVSKIAAGEAVGCMECDYCMPCGYGVDIPGNFRYYNDRLAAGEVPDMSAGADRSSAEWRRKAKGFLRGYDREIADRHQSQRCVKCFHCVNECQHKVFIVNELAALTQLTDDLRDWECREL